MSDEPIEVPPAAKAFEAMLDRLSAAESQLHDAVAQVHAAVKDLGRVTAEARAETLRLAGDQVRKMLARQFEREAQLLREQIKKDKAALGRRPA